MLKRVGQVTDLFAVAMRDGDTNATFDLTCVAPDATVTVLDEGRTLFLTDGSLADSFSSYQVHLYRIE